MKELIIVNDIGVVRHTRGSESVRFNTVFKSHGHSIVVKIVGGMVKDKRDANTDDLLFWRKTVKAYQERAKEAVEIAALLPVIKED